MPRGSSAWHTLRNYWWCSPFCRQSSLTKLLAFESGDAPHHQKSGRRGWVGQLMTYTTRWKGNAPIADSLNPTAWAGQDDLEGENHGDATQDGWALGLAVLSFICLSASDPRPPFLSHLLRYWYRRGKTHLARRFPMPELGSYKYVLCLNVDTFARAPRYNLGNVLGSPSDLSSPGTVQVERVRGRQG